MSKIQELKNDPTNNVNMVEIIKGLFPDLKTKYIELFLRISKNKVLESSFYRGLISGEYMVANNIKFSEYTPYEVILLGVFFSDVMRHEDVLTFMKFCEYNENHQIENSDVTAINNLDIINNEVSKVEMKNISKDMKNQLIKLHEDDEWLVIKPLTVLCSRKYGSNTKWCTTSAQEHSYFQSYASTGILIYVLNKKTGYKVAVFKDLKLKKSNALLPVGGDLTFWNQKDERIDSMEADIPMEISKVLANEIKNCKRPNRAFLTEEERIKEEKLFPDNNKTATLAEAPAPRNAIRVLDAEEELVEYAGEDPQNDRALYNDETEGLEGNYGQRA